MSIGQPDNPAFMHLEDKDVTAFDEFVEFFCERTASDELKLSSQTCFEEGESIEFSC